MTTDQQTITPQQAVNRWALRLMQAMDQGDTRMVEYALKRIAQEVEAWLWHQAGCPMPDRRRAREQPR